MLAPVWTSANQLLFTEALREARAILSSIRKNEIASFLYTDRMMDHLNLGRTLSTTASFSWVAGPVLI